MKKPSNYSRPIKCVNGNFLLKALELVRLGLMFPIYCVAYMIAPSTSSGVFMKNPFVKFICHSASFLCFLMLLACASQRVERITMQVIMALPDDLFVFSSRFKESNGLASCWLLLSGFLCVS